MGSNIAQNQTKELIEIGRFFYIFLKTQNKKLYYLQGFRKRGIMFRFGLIFCLFDFLYQNVWLFSCSLFSLVMSGNFEQSDESFTKNEI